MEWIVVVLQLLTLLGLAVAGWFVKSYFPSYLTEKAKNLATKEDVAAITRIVESVKVEYAREIELLKSALQRESDAIGKRREVYDDLVQALRVFTQDGEDQAKSDFISAYRHAWIWAPDSVIKQFNKIIDLNRLKPDAPTSDKERQIREAYVNAVVTMRRDAGHFETALTTADYRFFSF